MLEYINILLSTVLIVIIIIPVMISFNRVLKFKTELEYYNRLEQYCDKQDVIESETLRYNLEKKLDNINVTIKLDIISYVCIITAFIGLLWCLYSKEYVFITVYLIIIIVCILTIINISSNKINNNTVINRYRKAINQLKQLIKEEINRYNLKNFESLSKPLQKEFVNRYINLKLLNKNDRDVFSRIEALELLRQDIERLPEKGNSKVLDIDSMIKYLKMYKSSTEYDSDYHMLFRINIAENASTIFDMINPIYLNDREKLHIIYRAIQMIPSNLRCPGKDNTTSTSIIPSIVNILHPYLIKAVKDSFTPSGRDENLNITINDDYEQYVELVKALIYHKVYSTKLASMIEIEGKNIEHFYELYRLIHSITVCDTSSNKDITSSMEVLKKYLKENYKNSIKNDGNPEKTQRIKYNEIKYALKEHINNFNKLSTETKSEEVFNNLSRGLFNPYKESSKTINRFLLYKGIIISLIFYIVFHLVYTAVHNSKYGVSIFIISILLILFIISIPQYYASF
jgi:hypothetical protein